MKVRIKPTMSHAVNKAHYNELLIKYYQDLVSEYDTVVGVLGFHIKKGDLIKADEEYEIFCKHMDENPR